MSIAARILKSIQDGSFPIKLLNRISRTKYVPSQEVRMDEFLAEHYSAEGWKKFFLNAKRIWMDLYPVFNQIDIRDITYVGVHNGEVALGMDEAFPLRHFFLIEAAPTTFQKLTENVSSRPNMRCVNIAAAAKDETVDMFVDDFSAASSILPYSEMAIRESPFLGRGNKTRVKGQPLDYILQEHSVEKTDMLILDVQGYEDKVFSGALLTLESCKVVMSELSLQDLYLGSSTFDSVYRQLSDRKFRLRYLLNPIKGSGQMILRIDGTFMRE
jgi:FkbM family methyltransferase